MLGALRAAALSSASLVSPALHLRALSSFSKLPVIDVGALTDPDAPLDARQAVGAALHEACTHVGFFYVTNHGVPEAVTEGVLAEARRWFMLPEAVKRGIALSPATHYRGWQQLGTNVTRYDGGFSRDWHEGLDFYKEVDPAAAGAAGLSPSPVHGHNPWPQDPAFTAALRAYIGGCLRLGGAIMRGIALGLGLPERHFEGDVAGDSYWVTRVIYYPPLQQGSQYQAGGTAAAAPGAGADGGATAAGDTHAAAAGAEVARSMQLSCGEHTDYGLLTLVNQEPGVQALQVKNRDGRWVDAPPEPGTLVVNIGDMFRVLTNGLYTPTPHRVVNASARDRVSIPFFYETNFDTWISPLPQFCRDRPPAFQPVRYGAHLESKVLSNFDFGEAAAVGQGSASV